MAASAYSFSPVTTLRELEELVPAWTALYHASGSSNPFAHPLWMVTWASHFVPPSDLYTVAVRDDDGRLVGVAPFYRQRVTVGPALRATQLHLLGAGQHTELTELPQVVILPGQERAVLRALLCYLRTQPVEWDWIELALTPEQGWFEPEWLQRDGSESSGFVLHKTTRPCVVLPLRPSWDELRADLKRNVKENLRRGVNRLARESACWDVATSETMSDVTRGLGEVIRLHGARAALRGKARHANYVAHARDRDFLHDAARRMHAAGQLRVCLLRVEGTAVAGRLLLHGNGSTFLSLSGFDPRWWSYNVATVLTGACLRQAVERGDRLVNLSSGPDRAKLRWSERLELHQVFVAVNARRSSRAAFAVHWQLRAAHQMRRESLRVEDT